MISPDKVESIRRYLLSGNVSFVNNIIVTLPSNTKLLDHDGNTIDVTKIIKTEAGTVQLPVEYNSIGLIDGQHRVFSYYEGGANEEAIAILRAQQNLLVTGIMYPATLSEADRTRMAARLFLEINSNQTNAKTDLKQEINLILKPYDADSVAKKVLNGLNNKGPLEDSFERFFFDKYKLKTTTVVSYGLRPLVRLADDGPLFSQWTGQAKEAIKNGKNDAGLALYIVFCIQELNVFMSAARLLIGSQRWTSAPNAPDKLLNTTFINGLVSCFRRVAINEKLGAFEYYSKKLSGLEKFKFSAYRSSQYNSMGEEIYITIWQKNSV